MSMYSQHYISTGEKTKMYTLRHQYDEKVWYKGEGGQPESAIVRRDYYICNLSTDADKAQAKAKELGYECATPEYSLAEIQKREAGEAQKERELAEERFRATQKEKQDYEIFLASNGQFPFGRNQGRELSVLVEDYGLNWVEYWIKQGREESPEAAVKVLGSYLSIAYPKVTKAIDMRNGNGKHYGEPRQRVKNLKVSCVESFCFDGYYGCVYIEKFVTESGELLFYKGSACMDCSAYEESEISFTIKEHSDYEGVNQTVIQRVKIH